MAERGSTGPTPSDIERIDIERGILDIADPDKDAIAERPTDTGAGFGVEPP